ncbi:hypothetical protein AB0C77_29120 [Streptomyces sp. NPDC048629]|uniref:hypothetical protein n=1 Tax=Streptomyces sp. NPDC048629 TaxID=3154824 RepID=UPI00343DF477
MIPVRPVRRGGRSVQDLLRNGAEDELLSMRAPPVRRPALPPSPRLRRPRHPGWKSLTIVGTGDFNADKHADLIARTSTGYLYRYLGTGKGTIGSG